MSLQSLFRVLSPAVVVVLCACTMQAQTWSTNSAPIQAWSSISCSGDGARLVAATALGRIYTSANGGQKWTASNAPRFPWNSVALSKDGTTAVAVSKSGIAYSPDSGATWHTANAATNVWWTSVASSSDGSKWVAVGAHDGIYTSVDSGVTWMSMGAPYGLPWSAVASSGDGTTLVASANPGLIYISIDSGSTWTTSNVPVLSWSSLACSIDGTNLLGATLLGGIYISTNAGSTWSPTTAPTNDAWWGIACSGDGTNVFAGGFYNGICISADAGMTWGHTTAQSNTFYSVCVSSDGSKPAAAAYNGGIWSPGGSGPVNFSSSGQYQGLFYDTNNPSAQSSGLFTGNTTSNAVTAKLQLGGSTYSFSGRLPSTGLSTNVVVRIGLSNLTVVLARAAGGSELTGYISDGVWTAQLAAERAVYTKKSPAPQSGNKFSLALPSVDGSGDGFATISVDASGKVVLKGTLGEGTPINQTTYLSSQGQWPFFASLYSGSGAIWGWMGFTNGNDTAIDGQVVWLKPALAKAKLYPDGFTNVLNVLGSRYEFTNGVPLLNISTGEVRFATANLIGGFTNRFTLGPDNQPHNLGPNHMTLTLQKSTGVLRGSAVDASSGKTLNFNGAVLQKQNIGLGFFLGTNESGSVFITQSP